MQPQYKSCLFKRQDSVFLGQQLLLSLSAPTQNNKRQVTLILDIGSSVDIYCFTFNNL